MKTLLAIVITVLAFGLKAQNFKNEIQIDQAGVYHFDGNSFQMNLLPYLIGKGITYKRRLKHNFKVYGSFTHYRLDYYEPDGRGKLPQIATSEGKKILLDRTYQLYTLGASHEYALGNFLKLEPHAGFMLRAGGQVFFRGFIFDLPGPPAGFADADNLTALGFFTGTQLKATIFKRFNIGVQADYARFIKEHIKNQFFASVFIGFEFER